MSQCTGGRIRGGRRLRVVSAVAGLALVLAACGSAEVSATQLDAQFVDSVHADGRDVPRGSDGETALVAAARKICARRDHLTMRRRESALTPRELAAVEQVFAGDPRRFATLALATYCP